MVGCAKQQPPAELRDPFVVPVRNDFEAGKSITIPFVLSPRGNRLDPGVHEISVCITTQEEELEKPEWKVLAVPSVVNIAGKNTPLGDVTFAALPAGKYIIQVRTTRLVEPFKGDFGVANYHLHVTSTDQPVAQPDREDASG